MVSTAAFRRTAGKSVLALDMLVGVRRGIPGVRFLGVAVALLYPETLAVGQGFAFPERGASFQHVHDEFAGTESIATVGAGHADINDLFGQMQFAHTVYD